MKCWVQQSCSCRRELTTVYYSVACSEMRIFQLELKLWHVVMTRSIFSKFQFQLKYGFHFNILGDTAAVLILLSIEWKSSFETIQVLDPILILFHFPLGEVDWSLTFRTFIRIVGIHIIFGMLCSYAKTLFDILLPFTGSIRRK